MPRISFDELGKAMGELGLDVLPMCPRRSGFFDEWDSDKCGYIEYEELYTMQNDIRKSVVLDQNVR